MFLINITGSKIYNALQKMHEIKNVLWFQILKIAAIVCCRKGKLKKLCVFSLIKIERSQKNQHKMYCNNLTYISFIFIVTSHVIKLSSCCSPDILDVSTRIAKANGVSGAGDRCIKNNTQTNKTCDSDTLECNKVKDYSAPLPKDVHVCQIKSWIVVVSFFFFIIFPIIMIACLLVICYKYHCFSRILWWLTGSKNAWFWLSSFLYVIVKKLSLLQIFEIYLLVRQEFYCIFICKS